MKESNCVGGFGNLWGGSQYHQQDRVYQMGDIALCHPANIPGGSYLYLEIKKVGKNVIYETAEQTVRVRKHKVNIKALQNLLIESKRQSRLSNKKIAEKLDVPVTKVEHWFRKDESFAIPDEDIWDDLKKVLGIINNSFDAQIKEFEERVGVYEKSERVYMSEGLSPTLMAMTNAEKIVEVKKINVLGQIESEYESTNRVYSSDGISPTITTPGGGGHEPKVMEVKEVLIKQATNDGYIPCEIGGGGEPIISIKRNTKRKGTRERTDMSNTDNGEYP